MKRLKCPKCGGDKFYVEEAESQRQEWMLHHTEKMVAQIGVEDRRLHKTQASGKKDNYGAS